MSVARIRVGTSGYSFRDWAGPIYPPGLPQREWLTYYARQFDAVEINTTYYRVPSPRMMAAMAGKVDPERFTFVVKVPKEMTHDRGKLDQTVGPFLAAIRPLVEAGCLGGLLAQFPYSFKRAEEGSLEHLVRLRGAFPEEIPLHVEFRNRWWYRPEVLQFLAEHHLGFVNVDLPPLPGLPSDRTGQVTNGIGYFRFHGRNAAKWWEHETPGERYDYLYSEEELAEWVPEIERSAQRAELTFIFMNNCHRGKSAINAVQLQRRLNLRDPDDRAPWEILEQRLFG
ncbi:MAG: DUF72 domain-containing protein [Candidatus Bipolaricaulaceae bacterium]